MVSAIYEYKGNQYKVIHRAKLKNPQTGEWNNCVVYSPVSSSDVYVRMEWEFIQKFKKVKAHE